VDLHWSGPDLVRLLQEGPILPTQLTIPQFATYYAANLDWKLISCHGIRSNGKCTCDHAHTDPKDIGKHPALNNWQNDASSDLNIIESWFRSDPDYNIGVMAQNSGLVVIDIDPRSGGFEAFHRFEEMVNGEIPPTVTALTGAYQGPNGLVRGMHMYYRIDKDEQLIGKLESIAKSLKGVDIKHNGYVLVAPSRHVSGVNYEWVEGRAPWEIGIAEPSSEMLDLLRKSSRKKATPGSNGGWDFINDLSSGGEKLDLERFLADGISEGSRATDLYAMTCALANKLGTDDMSRKNIETMMLRFNHEMVKPPLEVDGPTGLLSHVHRAIDFVQKNPKNDFISKKMGYDISEGVALRDSGALSNFGGGDKIRSLAAESWAPKEQITSDPDDEHSGIDISMLDHVNLSRDVDALSEEDGAQIGSRSMTDTGNGRRIVDAFGRYLRYTPGLGWHAWNQNYWMPDVEELQVREISKRLGSIVAAEAAEYNNDDAKKAAMTWAKEVKSNARQSSAINAANSDPRIAVPVDQWDSNPHLLGVANGVVDLRTGELMQGRPDLHITRRAPVKYSKGLPSPRFQEFLDYATYGDKEYQDWLQRAFGYTLTGRRDYDVMFVLYGPAGSGKNVFVEALVKCLGTKEYAFPLDSSILAQGDGKASPADLYHWAELRGRRMIWVDELPESERLKENAVKKLTGSSEISARSPGEKPFTFESQGKLWITTNHRPIINDEAMWRRIRPIPWMHVPENPDPTLKAYLHDPEGGLPGILAWAVEGAMKLLASNEADALGWCTVVEDAAKAYRENEDRMGMFLDEETEEDVLATASIKHIFVAYEDWSEDRREKAMSQIAFTRKLSDRGIQITGTGGRAVVMGRRVRPPQHTPNANGSTVDYNAASRRARS